MRHPVLSSLVLLAACALGLPGSSEAQVPIVGSGSLLVTVTRDGAPVAGAVVCIGTSQDLNQFNQGQTDAQGHLTLRPIPANAFVATAHFAGRATQISLSPASPSLFILPLTLALGTASGPTCPTTPAGPSRPLIPRDLQPPTGTPMTWEPVQLKRAEFCFGALCAGGICFINGGSWDHDTCCAAHPAGMACRAGPLDAVTGHDGNCVTSWNKALRLTGKGLIWSRQVDFSRGNSTGTVEHDLYCAPRGAYAPPEDTPKCCTRSSRLLTTLEQAALAHHGEQLRACL
jgi:hypothetical protein